jgi:hypothetical protein
LNIGKKEFVVEGLARLIVVFFDGFGNDVWKEKYGIVFFKHVMYCSYGVVDDMVLVGKKNIQNLISLAKNYFKSTLSLNE